ncbi:hypothetical protein ACLOJK_018587 [Asimina triloba]
MHWVADIRSNDPDRSIVLGWTVVIRRRMQRATVWRARAVADDGGWQRRATATAADGGDSRGRWWMERPGGRDERPGSSNLGLADDEK